jgi:Protein of unknown function (DUF2013)
MEFDEEIIEVSRLLDKVEGKTGGDQIKLWVENLVSEEFGLVSYLVSVVFINTSSINSKVLRQLIELSFDSVVSQLVSNNFTINLSSYLINTELKELNLDLVHIYLEIYIKSKENLVLDEDIFMKIIELTETFPIKTIDYLIRFLKISIKDYFQCFFSSSKSLIIGELFLFDLNRSTGQDKLESLCMIHEILQKNSEFFYTNDTKSLFDIILQILDNQELDLYKISLLILTTLYSSNNFSSLKYKQEDLKETLKSLDDNEDYILYKLNILSKL